jgi:hypothetical protein
MEFQKMDGDQQTNSFFHPNQNTFSIQKNTTYGAEINFVRRD